MSHHQLHHHPPVQPSRHTCWRRQDHRRRRNQVRSLQCCHPAPGASTASAQLSRAHRASSPAQESPWMSFESQTVWWSRCGSCWPSSARLDWMPAFFLQPTGWPALFSPLSLRVLAIQQRCCLHHLVAPTSKCPHLASVPLHSSPSLKWQQVVLIWSLPLVKFMKLGHLIWKQHCHG